MKKMIKNKKGFTLIELIVVIAIIAILAAILVPSLLAYMEKASLRKADSNVKNVYTSASSAYTDLVAESQAVNANSIQTKTMELLGAGFDENQVTINLAADNTITSVSWGDGNYWATYTVNSNPQITHGKGAVGNEPIS